MLLVSGLSSYGFTYDNWGASPSATPGTSVVPGASNVEGSWTQVASTSNIARDVYWMQICVSSGFTSASQKDHVLDIGVDPAGGTSYAAVISDIVCGFTSALTGMGPQVFLFPLFIKSASSVAVRIQGSNATAGTVRVSVKFWGDPSNPENVPVGRYSETIGTIASSAGVSFTPNNGSDGAWVSLGTTTAEMWWWQLCVQVSNATINARQVYVDLAYGDATNKVIIARELVVTSSVEDVTQSFRSNLCWLSAYAYVPAGSNIYVRGRGSAAVDTGWNAAAIGIGG